MVAMWPNQENAVAHRFFAGFLGTTTVHMLPATPLAPYTQRIVTDIDLLYINDSGGSGLMAIDVDGLAFYAVNPLTVAPVSFHWDGFLVLAATDSLNAEIDHGQFNCQISGFIVTDPTA